MLDKIKQHYQKIVERLGRYLNELRDVRTIGLLLFLVVLLLITWSGVKAIDTNYGLQKQIAELEQKNAVQKLSNENAKLQNAYYNTPQYLELAARHDFGLAAPGETVLVVPRGVAMSHTVELHPPLVEEAKQQDQPAYERNFKSWMDFFLHREHAGD